MSQASSVTADQVLDLRKQYKRAKNAYNVARTSMAATDVPVSATKKMRKPRDPNRPRSEKELKNDARLKAQTALAKEIRSKNPTMKWTDAVREAAKQMKKA